MDGEPVPQVQSCFVLAIVGRVASTTVASVLPCFLHWFLINQSINQKHTNVNSRLDAKKKKSDVRVAVL